MNKDFLQYAYKRCENALTENDEYMALERDEAADPEAVQAKAEELCYIKGFNDAIQLILNSSLTEKVSD